MHLIGKLRSKTIAIISLIALGAGSLTIASSTASASSPERDALTSSAISTLEKLQAGFAFTLTTKGADGAESVSNVVANMTRYAETNTSADGQTGQLGVTENAGYTSANLLPFSTKALEAANLGPDSVVGFTSGVDNLGVWAKTALPPSAKIYSYYKYSAPGMWMEVLDLEAMGDARAGAITSSSVPGGVTRYTVPVESLTPDMASYTLTLDISPAGDMVASQANLENGITYTVAITAVGSGIIFPATPTTNASWNTVMAAKWRVAKAPKAVTAANNTKNRTLKEAKKQRKNPTVSMVREQAKIVAKNTRVAGANVRAWDIYSGARIEIRRQSSSGYIWTVGACTTVKDGKLRSEEC